MQDRGRSFFSLKSLFRSAPKTPSSSTPEKEYHYRKRAQSAGGPRQSEFVVDERTVHLLERSIANPEQSQDASVFRQLSVREPPASPPSPRTPPSYRSSGSSRASGSGSLSSTDSVHPSTQPSQPPAGQIFLSVNAASPRSARRPHTSSGVTGRKDSRPATQPPSPTPREVSYSRPTPYAYPCVRSRETRQSMVVVDVQPPTPSSTASEHVQFPFPSSPRQKARRADARPVTHHGTGDRMLVHAPVNRDWLPD